MRVQVVHCHPLHAGQWFGVGLRSCVFTDTGFRRGAQPGKLPDVEAQLSAELFVKFAQSLMWPATCAAMKPIEGSA